MEHSSVATVERSGDVRRSRDGAAPAWQEATVAAVIDETPGAVSLRLRPGEATGFLPGHPYGRFTWDGHDAGPVLLVGAGSGTVPLMSMIRHAAQRGGGDPVVLVCSAITYSHAFYRAELARLASRHPWLRVVHCSAL